MNTFNYNEGATSAPCKKEIRKTAVAVGVPLILLIALFRFWSYAVYGFMGIFGYSLSHTKAILRGAEAGEVLQIVISLIGSVLFFAVCAKICGLNLSKTVMLSKPKKDITFPLILFGVGFCAFTNIAVFFGGRIFDVFGVKYSVPMPQLPKTVPGIMLSIISTVIVPAFAEEFALRGVVMGSLKKFGNLFAVLTSAVLFSFLHRNFEQIPFTFFVGLVLGFVAVKANSIWPAMLIHGINNGISVFLDILRPCVSVSQLNLIYNFYLLIAMVLMIVSVPKISRLNGFSISKGECALTENEKYTAFFTHPLIIIFIAFCLIRAFSYFF